MRTLLDMMNAAETALTSPMMSLLDDPDGWHTLDVDYEPPRVERLWRDMVTPGYRLYLHRIHPCEKALFHPHPWPSAVKILHGSYEMAVGYGKGSSEPPVAATIVLAAGSYYEMTDPDGWHHVRPLGKHPSYSIMVTGPKWDRWSPKPKHDHVLGPLTDEVKRGLLCTFGAFYGR